MTKHEDRTWTRRAFLAGLATLPVVVSAVSRSRAAALYAYVGCFTSAQRYARGSGLHVYRVDPDSGAWSPVQVIGDLVNPSFLVTSPDQRFLYSAHGDEGYATAFSVNHENGTLDLRHRAETGGRNGVHLAIDPRGRFLIVANYASGSVSVLPVRPDGTLGDVVQVVPLPGQPGPNRVELASSHYWWEAERGHLRPVQILPSIPSDYTGENTAAEIATTSNGGFVYCSNRGHDSVALFSANADTGLLTSVGWEPSQGRTPRFIGFDPSRRFLFCANEQSDTIVAWRVAPATGRLTRSGPAVRSPSPVTIAFTRW